jgi:PAS domain S-box-containing protein
MKRSRRFNWKRLFAHGPETIAAENVFIKDIPLEELALTLFYILLTGLWLVFSSDLVNWIMGIKIESPTVHTLRGINFATTTGILLYLVLRRTSRRRRLAEEALRLTQKRFEYVAHATTDAIWDLNLETNVVWWSEGMQKLFGYRPEDVSSKFEWWLQRVHPADRDRVVQAIQSVIESGKQNWRGEYRFERQDKTYATVLDRGYIIRDPTGKPVRVVGGLSDVSEQRLAEQALERSREQLRALTARLQAGREEERATIAREIHDDLGQMLTAIKINLDWLERHLGESQGGATPELQLERVVESTEMVEALMQSVQRIATDLRPSILDNLGLPEALREEARRFQERSGVSCEFQLAAGPLSLPSDTSIAIFRVFQEALTNVARHAKASAVAISLEQAGLEIILCIEDNGRGIRPEALNDSNSLGLLGMTERAAAAGGQIAITPISPYGTRVTLRLPLKRTSAAL